MQRRTGRQRKAVPGAAGTAEFPLMITRLRGDEARALSISARPAAVNNKLALRRWRGAAMAYRKRRQNRTAEADPIPPAWRLTWWDFTGFHDWVGRKGTAKTERQPHPQEREFDTEQQARRFIKDLKKRLGSDNVAVKLVSLRELLAPGPADQLLPGRLAEAADITIAVRALRRAPGMIVARARAPPGAPKAPSRTLERQAISRASGSYLTYTFWHSSRCASHRFKDAPDGNFNFTLY